jgi:hypothetical protein
MEQYFFCRYTHIAFHLAAASFSAVRGKSLSLTTASGGSVSQQSSRQYSPLPAEAMKQYFKHRTLTEMKLFRRTLGILKLISFHYNGNFLNTANSELKMRY